MSRHDTETTTRRRVARLVVVHGRVQGVFFRDTCRQRAQENGVAGWVRNEHDGTVRALFEGEPAAVDRLVSWVHQGPRRAGVERGEVEPVQPSDLTGFQVR
jgi:acylphosphatase